MQLGQAEALGVLDHHDVGVGHVDADLDHGGRHQDLEPAGGERGHGRVLGLVRHGRRAAARRLGAEDLRQMRVPLLGGGELGLVGALDQRAHPVDLRALGELRAQALDQALDRVDRDRSW